VNPMSEQRENTFELRRDGLGIVLFTVGAFFSVLLVLAFLSSEPLDRAEGTAALARMWAGGIGLLPALVFCGGTALFGAHLFLVGGADMRRRIGGLAIVSLGVAVLLGAFSPTAGGFVGNLTAGALSRSVHVVLGAVAGLVILASAVWVAWIRPTRPAAETPQPEHDPEIIPARPSQQGVTAEEAAALVPEDLPSWRAEPRKETLVRSMPAAVLTTHREDLRRRGEIPEGARPLETSHVATQATAGTSRPIDEPSISSVQHWSPAAEPGGAADPVGEDLAPDEELETVLDVEDGLEVEEEVSAAELDPIEDLEEDLEEEEEDVEDEAVEVMEAPEPEVAEAPVLRPSWEQPSLFTVEEEPVDAYGTPVAAEDVAVEPGDVVLTPAPAPPGKERSRLLAEVGCLLVDRGRVAVSLLQKQYEMDFEEATQVLDELQVLGLIGPYLGGQRRDILLTRDEWLEKVSSL
jgi:hypothetical protein